MRKTTLALVAVLIVGLIGSAGLVSAFPGKGGERNSEAKDALLAGDYDAWVNALEGTQRGDRILERITEEDFDEMSEAFQERQAHKEAVEAAIEAEDFDAWKEAIEDNPYRPAFMDDITEEQFDTVIAIHEAKEAGDYETAKELREDLADELGLNLWHGKFKRFGHGFHRS